jgi:hypothetical protein
MCVTVCVCVYVFVCLYVCVEVNTVSLSLLIGAHTEGDEPLLHYSPSPPALYSTSFIISFDLALDFNIYPDRFLDL